MKWTKADGFVSLALSMLLVASFLTSGAMYGVSLEESEEWEESGDTIVHSVFAYDVDGDDTVEILTAGSAYTGTKTEAQLRIWSWNGTTLTLEKNELASWASCTETVFLSVFAGDVDDDGIAEIVLVGYGGGAGTKNGIIAIWNWTNNVLGYEGNATKSIASEFRGVYAMNFTDSSLWEILVTGYDTNQSKLDGVLFLWNWNGTAATREAYTTWQPNTNIVSNSVYAYDVDADTVTEILTTGYDEPSVMYKKYIELRIWNYTSGSFNLETDQTWQPYALRDAEGLSVSAANVDADLVDEILVAGYTYNTTNKKYGYTRICSWRGGTFSHEGVYEKYRGNEELQFNSVYAQNLNQDSYIEIILGGKFLLNSTYNGNLTVLQWDGSSHTLLAYDEWYTTSDTALNSVHAKDVDDDNTIEILGGGQANDGTNENGQLRIWHLS